MTPGIPDKQTVFQITRSNYYKLIKAGVKIYEYTPGFNHRKNVVADDMCLIGTVNTDYRSYFLQFENGVLMHDPHMAETMRKAFEAGLEQAEQITLEKFQSVNGVVRLYRAILALMAPLF